MRVERVAAYHSMNHSIYIDADVHRDVFDAQTDDPFKIQIIVTGDIHFAKIHFDTWRLVTLRVAC